jgi:hypothetical protein
MAIGKIPAPADYVLQIPEKKTLFQKLFTLEQVGMQVWIIGTYLNATNEEGPDGVSFNTTII